MLVDIKQRAMDIGSRVRVEENIQSPEGMLYKNQIVKIDDFNNTTKKIRVTDNVGKVWWIEPSQVSCSFL